MRRETKGKVDLIKRDAVGNEEIDGESAAEDERGIAWAREFFAKVQPFASGGAYINFLTQDETARIAFAYGATYTRLVELKKKYDPTNFFRMNQNIKPI